MPAQQSFYDYHQATCWPLLETCTRTSDTGQLLPDGLLADLHLWLPASLAEGAFLGAISGTAQLVSLVILADNPERTPLASLSLLKSDPELELVSHPLEPLSSGVQGWVTLGADISDLQGDYRFSSPTQSQIQPASVVAYADQGLKFVSRGDAETPLTGLVRLSGEGDVELVSEVVTIFGEQVPAIVARLKQNPAAERNVFDVYRGACNQMAESGNCVEGEPLEFINNVGPDCCGRLMIEFQGCAAISQVIDNECSITVDCGIPLADACVTPPRLPDDEGRLPNEFDDLCEEEEAGAESWEAAPEIEPIIASPSAPKILTTFQEFDPTAIRPPHPAELSRHLPYLAVFSQAQTRQEIPTLVDRRGQFALQRVAPGANGLRATRRHSLAVAQGSFLREYDWGNLYKQYELGIHSLGRGDAFLVVNFRTATEIDVVRQALLLGVGPGDNLMLKQAHTDLQTDRTPPLATRPIPQLDPERYCRLLLQIFPDGESFTSAWVLSRLVYNNGEESVELSPTRVTDYENPIGTFGIYVTSPGAAFQSLHVTNQTELRRGH